MKTSDFFVFFTYHYCVKFIFKCLKINIHVYMYYGFVWISEPMVVTLFLQLCLKTVLSAHYWLFYGIYSGKKYKTEDDCIM